MITKWCPPPPPKKKSSKFCAFLLLQVSELDFQDSIAILGFSQGLCKDLLGLYTENRAEIRSILGEMAMDLPHYRNLEWRLDVEVRGLIVCRDSTFLSCCKANCKDLSLVGSHEELKTLIIGVGTRICLQFYFYDQHPFCNALHFPPIAQYGNIIIHFHHPKTL